MRLIVVGCARTKALPVEQPQVKLPAFAFLPAKDLYVSPLFRKRRDYAERCVREGHAIAWCILSALHGVVEPDAPLAAYDFTMKQRPRGLEREQWGWQVVNGYHGLAWIAAGRDYDRQRKALDGSTIEIHAGVDYVEAIAGHLMAAHAKVERPLEGLGIGKQQRWYDEQAAAAAQLQIGG